MADRDGAAERARDEGLIERVDAAGRWKTARSRWGVGLAGRLRRTWRQLAYGIRPQPLPSYDRPVEPPPREGEPRVGICCSGGGIRSAAFNLGALQTLEEEGELSRADYMAAVSGGSYIAAAFTMVGRTWTPDEPRPPRPAGRLRRGADGVEAGPGRDRSGSGPDRDSQARPGHDDSDPELIAREAPFAPGTPEEQYLRNRVTYLAPGGMGKLYLALRVLLGFAFNVVFLATPLVVLTIVGALLFHVPELSDGVRLSAAPDWWWIAPVALAAAGIALGLLQLAVRMPSDYLRLALRTWSARSLLAAAGLAWFFVAMPVLLDLVTPDAAGVAAAPDDAPVEADADTSRAASRIGAVGLAGLLAGVAATVAQLASKAETAATAAGRVSRGWAKLGRGVRRLLVYAGAVLAGPILAGGLMLLTSSLLLQADHHDWWIAGAAIATALFALAYGFGDMTSWSLHPFYRRRLASAFALKRVRRRDADLAAGACPACGGAGCGPDRPSCGEDDPVAVERDYDTLVPLSRTARDDSTLPLLVVCAAANISDPGATPPGRGVTSFTFSPDAVGGPLVGGVRTEHFERAFGGPGRRNRDLTLLAAVAMSGAAVAPSMGKIAPRAFSFLLALANIRLGVWVPHPGWATATRERSLFGRARPIYLVRELLGRNRVDARYLFVTDGGHYENLGLVELLRRGCTEIYCFDASGGEPLEQLGDAVALARSELGVEVDIDPRPLRAGIEQPPEAEGGSSTLSDGAAVGGNAAVADGPAVAEREVIVGTFAYPGVDGRPGSTGRLVYATNVVTDEAPWDVKAYHKRDRLFPRNPTTDQLFTDQKFESYRVLGRRAARRAVGELRDGGGLAQRTRELGRRVAGRG